MKFTVLLVDDDLALLQSLIRNFRKEPYEFRTATSAEEALGIFSRSTVDLVVCDWRMSGMTGTEFLARVAKAYPETKRIMLTGHATLDMVIGAVNNAGIHRFYTKPFEVEKLAVAIRELLVAIRKGDRTPQFAP
jgi:DNA-binding NtrC family response regulator